MITTKAAIEALKRRVDLNRLIGRDVALKQRGREFVGLSPFTNERTPSFTVVPHRGFWHCFSSGRHGDAISWLTEVHGLSLAGAVAELCSFSGYPAGLFAEDRLSSRIERIDRKSSSQHKLSQRENGEAHSKMWFAAKIWRGSSLCKATAAGAYLRARGIVLDVPPSLRFACLEHRPSASVLPAMVGIMTDGIGRFAGVHRTYLDPEQPRKAALTPNKMMLGHARGACVRLCPPAGHLYLAEGIETALSVMQVCAVPVWAALSRNNMGLAELPVEVQTVTLLADNDSKDWRAGRSAMRHAAHRHGQNGRDCYVAWPPRGTDFNDLLVRTPV